jgi:hypothetical protein
MKGYIYSIRSHQTKDIYIGSTEQQLSSRMSGHRAAYKMWINGYKKYCKSFEITKYGDSYIELIIEVEVQSKQDMRRIEGEHQRATECVNTRIAGRTKKEYCENNKEQRKEYYRANAEHIIEQRKEYYEINKEKIIEYHKKYNEVNKEQLCEQQKKYYESNKEHIIEKHKEKMTCECGSVICKGVKSRHLKTKRHINYLNNL